MAVYRNGTAVTAVYRNGTAILNIFRDAVIAFGPTRTVTVDDRTAGTGDLQWDYSAGWQQSNIDHYTSTTGATATLRWTGTRAVVFGSLDAHHGQMSFAVDGGAATTVDTYAASRTASTALFDTGVLANAAHTLVVTCLGTKNASSGGVTVAIDKAEVVSSAGASTSTGYGNDYGNNYGGPA